jgi:hypothetical protein
MIFRDGCDWQWTEVVEEGARQLEFGSPGAVVSAKASWSREIRLLVGSEQFYPELAAVLWE